MVDNILTTVVSALQNIAIGINKVGQIFANGIPNTGTATSPTATAGAATLPANPAAFLPVTVNGVQYKMPLYNP